MPSVEPVPSLISKFDPANLRQRVLSAAVLIPLVLLIVYLGGWVYDVAVIAVMILGLREWRTIVRNGPLSPKNTGACASALWWGLGLLYLGGGGLGLIVVRAVPDFGFANAIFLLVAVWATDTGAYFAGRLIGGPKLAPVISPKKTWAGLLGGMAFAAVLGYAVASGFGMDMLSASVMASVLAVVSQVGDLFESWVKRRFGVKDSGDLIPGHGGILDRIDGLLFAAIFFALCGAIMRS